MIALRHIVMLAAVSLVKLSSASQELHRLLCPNSFLQESLTFERLCVHLEFFLLHSKFVWIQYRYPLSYSRCEIVEMKESKRNTQKRRLSPSRSSMYEPVFICKTYFAFRNN